MPSLYPAGMVSDAEEIMKSHPWAICLKLLYSGLKWVHKKAAKHVEEQFYHGKKSTGLGIVLR